MVGHLSINDMEQMNSSSPTIRLKFANPKLCIRPPPKPATLIGCLVLSSRGPLTASKTDNEMMLRDDP